MKLDFETHQDILIGKISGSLNYQSAGEFRKTALANLSGHRAVVWNLADLQKLDNYGLDALLAVQLQAMDRQIAVKFAQVGVDPQLLFDVTEAYKIFDIYDTVEAALQAVQEQK